MLISISSIILVLDSPLNDPKSTTMKILYYLDFVTTIFFMLEAIIKIIAKGLIWQSIANIKPYMSSYWNVLDLIVVIASLLNIGFELSGVSMSSFASLKSLRALRGLRPLRVIARNEGLRLVVNALLSSLPSMMNVLLICILFILIFAIMGLSFFKGQYASCHDVPKELLLDKLIDNSYDCINHGGLWLTSNQNFDTIENAMLNLFIMTNSEGWVEVMYNGIDGRGIGMQPQQDFKQWTVIFFISFMIVGS